MISSSSSTHRDAIRQYDAGTMPPLAPMLRRIASVDSEIAGELAEIDVAQLRAALYPVTKRYAYLNHAASGSLSLPVERAMQRFLRRQSEAGSLAFEEYFPQVDRIREQFAAFIGSTSETIAFTKNVSDGLNIVASGLNLHPGDNIVTAETEFPSNVYPWLNLRPQGVEVRFAPAHDARILTADLATLIDERTRLVSLSFVEFGTGYRNDLAAAAKLAHDAGALFSVDAIQGLGALRLNVSTTGIDFLATGSLKWLLGASNQGILYIRSGLLEQFAITTQRSWLSVVKPFDMFNYEQPLRADSARIEGGSNNIMGLVGLDATLAVFKALDMEEVEARVLALSDLTRESLVAEGYDVISPNGLNERSGIICFRPHGAADESKANTLAHELAEQRVVVSPRNGLLRVSPHFYNTPGDIERLIQALGRIEALQ